LYLTDASNTECAQYNISKSYLCFICSDLKIIIKKLIEARTPPIKKIEKQLFLKIQYVYDLTTLAKHTFLTIFIMSERSRFRTVGCCSALEWIIDV